MTTRDEIKSIIFREGTTINAVADKLSKKLAKKLTPNVLSQKLARDTLRYHEAKQIADILGYDLEFKKRKT